MEPIVDTELSLAFKRRALGKGLEKGIDFLAARAAEDLSDRLATVQRSFNEAAALFCLTEHAQNAMLASGKARQVHRVEADGAFTGADVDRLAPFETVPLAPESLDLAVSLLTLQEANDIPGMLVQLRRVLRPDGLFLGAMLGAGTLDELRQSFLQAEAELTGGASPRVLPFADVRDAGALLQRAGFALPVADLETLTVRYSSAFALMNELRAMGAANALHARSRRPLTRPVLLRMAEIYAERFSDPDGRVRATFNVIWMSGWAPDAAQPRPARRGSATVSLEQTLKTL